MIVLVCGGRDNDNKDYLFQEMDRINKEYKFTNFICGAGWKGERPAPGDKPGADWLAWQWALERHLGYTLYPAQWEAQGKAAGPIRNQLMLDHGKPDLVVAFPGGRGTADMINRAKAAKVSVIQIM